MLRPRRVLLMYETSHEISYLYIRNSAPQDRGEQRPLRDGPIGPRPPARPAPTTHPQLLVYAATNIRTEGVRAREGLGHRGGVERRAGGWSSDPMREAGAPSTEEATLAHRVGARPTGGSHGLIV